MVWLLKSISSSEIIAEDNETISSHFRSNCYDHLTEGSILHHIDEEYLGINQFEEFIL